jgi:hypothetical protein
MRVVKEIVNPNCRITILNWNNKYLIKLETSMMEQTYKIDQFDVASEAEVVQMLDEQFIAQAMKRFEEMAIDFREAVKRAE